MLSHFLTIALCAFAVQAIPVAEEFSWNELVLVKDLFNPEINTINARSGENSVVLEELENLLEQDGVLKTVYNRYLVKFNKPTPANYSKSMKVFAAALVRVITHNLEVRNGEHTFHRGINQYSDISAEELRARRTRPATLPAGTRPSRKNPPRYAKAPADVDNLPDSFDWRTTGLVTPIKDQLNCESCTQFATTAQLETIWAYFRNDPSAVNLSPQEMMDCSEPGVNNCKEGAWPETTYAYMMQTGATTWDQYPYTGVYGACQAAQDTHTHFVQDHFEVWDNTEDDIKKGVIQNGPIYISINVTQALQDYRSPNPLGVFNGPCNADLGTHSVLVIGYGTDDDGNDYWLIKNSWNESWGYNGYLKMARGVNQCGITSHPRILTVPLN